MKVLITPRSFSKAGEEAVKLLMEKGYEVIENRTGRTYAYEEMSALCIKADGIIVGGDTMDARVLRNAKNLKAISKYGAGVDNIDLNIAKELGIKVSSAAGANATSVAELTIGLIFAISRNIVKSATDVKNGNWEKIFGCGITGKTIGIVGLGHIGMEVARMAFGLGMKINGYTPHYKDNQFTKMYGINQVGFEDLLKGSDIVTLHLPLTDKTNFIINKDTLKLMKKTAFLINTSRGGLIDEEALYEALINGVIAGAAQDVFSKEPPESKNKLLCLDNFILTPHTGAYTPEAIQKMVLLSTENLIDMLEEK